MDRPFYTPTECAKRLHTSPQTVRMALQTKTWDFPYLMCGNRMKIAKEPFDAWFEKKKEGEKAK